MFSSSLISLCPTTKVYDVFNENVLPTGYDEQPIAMATTVVIPEGLYWRAQNHELIYPAGATDAFTLQE